MCLATSINRKLHNQSNRRFDVKLSQGSHSGKPFSTLTSHSIETDRVAKRYSRSYGMFLQLQKLKTNSWRLLNASAPTFGHLYKYLYKADLYKADIVDILVQPIYLIGSL